MKRVFISQSNYIPWKGFFDTLACSDIYVLYDDMQYTRRDWRNRNRIKTSNGLKWLTIPVEVKGKYHQKIKDTRISDSLWNEKHWDILYQSYRNAPCYKEVSDWLKPLYLNCKHHFLSEINYHFIRAINDYLGIETELKFSSEFSLHEERTLRLLKICEELQATDYITGPSVKNYIDIEPFKDKNISLTVMNFENYSEYDQLYPPFEHSVTILDLLFQKGSKANQFMKFA